MTVENIEAAADFYQGVGEHIDALCLYIYFCKPHK